MMNKIGYFFVFVMFFLSNSYSQKVVEESETVLITEHVLWQPTFKKAIEKAANEQKPILIYFTGSDWCGPCIQLDEELFHTEKFETFSKENLTLYMADFPRNRDLVTAENQKINKELSKKYSQTSFPTLLVIDTKGNVLGQKNGKYMAEYYYPFLEGIVNQYK